MSASAGARRADACSGSRRRAVSGRVLRYVGRARRGEPQGTVGLVELERSHPFANINLTDNIVRFVTSRYDQNPLVVQGPGAGPA